jgi:hypothetical protein
MVTIKCTKRAEFLTLPSKYEVDLLDLINLQKSKGAEKIMACSVATIELFLTHSFHIMP